MQRVGKRLEAVPVRGTGAAAVAVLLLTCLLTLPGATDVAQAQTGGQAGSDTTMVSQAPPPQQSQARKAPSQAGYFAQGRKRVGLYGGAGGAFGQTYLIVGGGAGYFVVDGLEIGADFEGWILQSPVFWRLTPGIRYTVWQLKRFSPYAGAFYRWNFISGATDNIASYGGRFGVLYRSGKGFAGVGAVYEVLDSDLGEDSSWWYPEVSFSLYF